MTWSGGDWQAGTFMLLLKVAGIHYSTSANACSVQTGSQACQIFHFSTKVRNLDLYIKLPNVCMLATSWTSLDLVNSTSSHLLLISLPVEKWHRNKTAGDQDVNIITDKVDGKQGWNVFSNYHSSQKKPWVCRSVLSGKKGWKKEKW